MCERLSKAHPPQPASPHPLGSRQQQILAELKGGPMSMVALLMRLGARTANERSAVHGVVRRLESLGRIKVSERKGKQVAGVLVELVGEG